MPDGSLRGFVVDHPEISYSVLIYTWNQLVIREYDLDDNVSFCERLYYSKRDPNYSCIGDRADLLKFADECDVWDPSIDDLHIVGDVLTGYILACDYVNGDSSESKISDELFFNNLSEFSIVDPYEDRDFRFDFHRVDI